MILVKEFEIFNINTTYCKQTKIFQNLNIKILNHPLNPQVTVQSGTVSEAPYSKIALMCSLDSQSAIIILLLILCIQLHTY